MKTLLLTALFSVSACLEAGEDCPVTCLQDSYTIDLSSTGIDENNVVVPPILFCEGDDGETISLVDFYGQAGTVATGVACPMSNAEFVPVSRVLAAWEEGEEPLESDLAAYDLFSARVAQSVGRAFSEQLQSDRAGCSEVSADRTAETMAYRPLLREYQARPRRRATTTPGSVITFGECDYDYGTDGGVLPGDEG